MRDLDTTGRTLKRRTVRSELVVGQVKRVSWLRYAPWPPQISEQSTDYTKEPK